MSLPLVAEYDNMLRCIRCAACLTSCPTYVVTHKEEEGPRGRIAIMRAIVEGHLEITPDGVQHLDNCLLCEACSNVCPTGVQMERLGIAFRETLAARSTRPRPLAARIAFGWLFGELSHFRLLARLIWLYQRSGVQWLARHLGILRVLRLHEMESLLPRVPSHFILPKGQTVGNGSKVQMFVGCIMSTAFAQTTEATARLVAAFGSQAEFTTRQVCCGALQAHSGDLSRARELAAQNVAAFGDHDAPIVVNAAGCGAMLKHYGQLLPDDPHADHFARRVKDVSEFLAERQPTHPPRELPLTIAIQDACHLLHAQRIADAPRQLLRAVPGVKLTEIAEREICCGSAGIYNVSHPEMSADLQRRKCANIAATGCDVVVTGNPGCFVQIQAGLPPKVRVRHIVDVLAEAYDALKSAIAHELRGIVAAGYVHDAPSEIIAYSFDGTFQQRRPDLVVSPATTEEVAHVVRVAAREKMPIIARGASSGLAGGTIPESGGLILNLARMDHIVEIDTSNVCAVAQAGVVTLQLQHAVERVGLFYPPDPASSRQSTIGGNVATNAGGPRCLKYGVTRDYVIGLTVVLASGEIMRLGGKVTKNATGYQLLQLIVGSEGTLGIVTEVIVKLVPLPRARVTAVAFFDYLTQASQAVSKIMGSGILPATLELMDGTTINVVEDFLNAGLPRQAQALLLLEQDGADETVARAEVERMAEICRSLGATQMQVATSAAERDKLWQARRSVSAALGRLRPNKLGEDIVVPKSEIPAMIDAVREIAATYQLPIPVFGHAGDGNLHPNILFDLRDPDEVQRVELAARDLFRAALRLGGTLSGEHGVGTLKREFLEEAHGPLAVSLARGIKSVFDPHGLLNPGKVFPTGRGTMGFLSDLPTLQGATPG